MAKIDDQKLSSLIDGELPEEEAADLNAGLINDAQSAHRLAQLGNVDALLRGAVDRLEQADDQGNTLSARPARGSDVAQLPPRVSAANDNWWKLPLAASVALAVGLFTGGALFPSGDSGQEFSQFASFDNGSQTGNFLETARGGELQKVGSSKAEIRLTFVGNDGDPCREFVVFSDTSATQAVACRRPEGRWETVLAAAAPVGFADEAQGYQTASDEGEAFGLAVSAMMQSDALGAEAESQLIEEGWED